jgi:putative transposase
MTDDEIIIKRRNLPHWCQNNSVYFVTYSLLEGKFTDNEKQIIYNHLIEKNNKHYKLHAFTVMSNHVHLIFECILGYSLSNTMKGIKGVSAYKINKYRNAKGSIWQDESFDRIIRDEKEYNEKLVYIYNNAFKAGLVDNPEDYKWWYFNEHL